jgi:hypothetical protein
MLRPYVPTPRPAVGPAPTQGIAPLPSDAWSALHPLQYAYARKTPRSTGPVAGAEQPRLEYPPRRRLPGGVATAQGLADRVDLAILPRALADRASDAALVAAIVAHAPAVLGLSLYTWNSERSLLIAARVRERLPNLIVIVGGPEVQAANRWILDHPAVDLAVIGEGEQTFAAILTTLAEQWKRQSALSTNQYSAFCILHSNRSPVSPTATRAAP